MDLARNDVVLMGVSRSELQRSPQIFYILTKFLESKYTAPEERLAKIRYEPDGLGQKLNALGSIKIAKAGDRVRLGDAEGRRDFI